MRRSCAGRIAKYSASEWVPFEWEKSADDHLIIEARGVGPIRARIEPRSTSRLFSARWRVDVNNFESASGEAPTIREAKRRAEGIAMVLSGGEVTLPEVAEPPDDMWVDEAEEAAALRWRQDRPTGGER